MSRAEEMKKMREELSKISEMKDLDEKQKKVLYDQIMEKYGLQNKRNEHHINHVEAGGQQINAPVIGSVNSGCQISNGGAIINKGSSFGNVVRSTTTIFSKNDSKSTVVDNREGIMQRSNIGNSSDKPFLNCPYCGEDLNLPKTPKFCPHCGEQMTV